MRNIEIWRDAAHRIYAVDSQSGERYTFLDYVGAITENASLQIIVSNEVVADMADFAAWLDEEPAYRAIVGNEGPEIVEGIH